MKLIAKIVLGLAAAAAIGCSKPQPTSGTGPASPQDPAQTKSTSSNAPEGQGGGIAPMAGVGAGPMTPVSGAESVDGAGGGGVGQAAKDKAKSMAATAPSSINQAGEDGG